MTASVYIRIAYHIFLRGLISSSSEYPKTTNGYTSEIKPAFFIILIIMNK